MDNKKRLADVASLFCIRANLSFLFHRKHINMYYKLEKNAFFVKNTWYLPGYSFLIMSGTPVKALSICRCQLLRNGRHAIPIYEQ